ncbi:MAG TPA: toll/interleukin-1 receptor domain-containing protein, partial [Streptosporangiaceae bacterium]
MKVFLSYAEEDRAIASRITYWLDQNRVDVYNWLDPERRGGQFIKIIEEEIHRADFFLILLSPDFLKSAWCRNERDMAMRHEQTLQESDPTAAFIRVLQVRPTPESDAGFIGNYDWLDFTPPANIETEIRELADRLRPGHRQGATDSAGRIPLQAGLAGRDARPDPLTFPQRSSLFRDRQDELNKVLLGLTRGGGPHFWLVVAPPQLGKTWLLQRVSADESLSEGRPWVTRLVDLRAEPAKVRRDASAILTRLFARADQATPQQDAPLSIAREILRTGRPYLCLLDSAELLDEETASTLRRHLTRIYHLVQDAGVTDVRLAAIVASRRDDYWKGVTPDPRLSPLSLAEFKPDVVQQAMYELDQEMGRHHYPADVRRYSVRVHRLTEGLPALLMSCLEWIRAEQWLVMERLEGQDLFEQLAVSYIQEQLLTEAS